MCGSDIHGYDGSTGRRIPPLVMGHEAAGVIERVREPRRAASRPAIASRSTRWCRAARVDFCRRGQINLCDNRMVLGVSCGDYRRHGAFAEYVSVPARILYKLPENLPFERAALTEAVSIAVHAVNRHVPAADDTAIVVGAGMIGLLTIQVLKAKGVRTIVAVDVDARKLELARRMGATQARGCDSRRRASGGRRASPAGAVPTSRSRWWATATPWRMRFAACGKAAPSS